MQVQKGRENLDPRNPIQIQHMNHIEFGGLIQQENPKSDPKYQPHLPPLCSCPALSGGSGASL
jgi:hypothetical protein